MMKQYLIIDKDISRLLAQRDFEECAKYWMLKQDLEKFNLSFEGININNHPTRLASIKCEEEDLTYLKINYPTMFLILADDFQFHIDEIRKAARS